MKKTLHLLIFLLLTHFIKAQPAENWWNKSVFYEVFVRSYFDSDNNGKGDFVGLANKLDYLNDGNPNTKTDLGIKGIWLMPINESPSYHGYDVTNYKGVSKDYGNLNDFKTLINEAHKRGIKVIIDFVINHTSSKHPWFVKSAANDPFYRDFYVWSSTKPNIKGPWGQDIWYSKNGSNYYALFWSEMPDLNYKYKPVKDSIFDAAKFWIDSMKVDGFRLDAAMYLFENGNSIINQPQTFEFWTEFNQYCKSLNPDFMTVGEVWSSSSVVKQYNNVLDNCFEFDLATSILQSIKTSDTYLVRNSAFQAYQNFNYNRFSTFLTNHDQNRVFDEFSGDIDKLKVAASVYLTLPGTPYLYYGEEIGMAGSKPDEKIRTPMQWNTSANAGFSAVSPWIATNANFASYNVEIMKNDTNSLLSHYKKLIQIRNDNLALSVGKYQNVICNENSIYSFARVYNNQTFLVCINTSENSLSNVSFALNNLNLESKLYRVKNVLSNSTENLNMNNGQADGFSMEPFETKIMLLTGNVSDNQDLSGQDWAIFPNPVSHELHLILNNAKAFKDKKLEVIDLNGKLLLQEELSGNEEQSIPVENLSKGMYLVKIGSYYQKITKY
jgi:glycosidase